MNSKTRIIDTAVAKNGAAALKNRFFDMFQNERAVFATAHTLA